MSTPDPASEVPQSTPAPRGRRAVRLTLLILAIAVLIALAASLQLNGR